MRHYSERVPGKNYRPISGKPLFRHILDTLLLVEEISEVIIDTDSDLIMEELDKFERYDQVVRIRRPENLTDPTESMNAIIAHDLQFASNDFILQTHSTNPLLTADTITKAIEQFRKSGECDSLFGVTKVQTRFYDAEGKPVNHDPDKLLRTQDLPPYFEENSTLYLFSRQSFKAGQNRLGKKPEMFEVSAEEAIDIDNETDFRIAECLLSAKHGESK